MHPPPRSHGRVANLVRVADKNALTPALATARGESCPLNAGAGPPRAA